MFDFAAFEANTECQFKKKIIENAKEKLKIDLLNSKTFSKNTLIYCKTHNLNHSNKYNNL